MVNKWLKTPNIYIIANSITIGLNLETICHIHLNRLHPCSTNPLPPTLIPISMKISIHVQSKGPVFYSLVSLYKKFLLHQYGNTTHDIYLDIIHGRPRPLTLLQISLIAAISPSMGEKTS